MCPLYFPDSLNGMLLNSSEKFGLFHQISAAIMLVGMVYFLIVKKGKMVLE